MKLARLGASFGAIALAVAATCTACAAMPVAPHSAYGAAARPATRAYYEASMHGSYVGEVRRGTPVGVYVHLQGQHEAELESFVDALETPGSYAFGRYLTPEEFGRYFGATQADLNEAVSALRAAGFTIEEVAENRTDILAHAPVERVERFFQTPIDLRSDRGRPFFAARFEPLLPPALHAQAVSGLDDYNQFHNHMLRSNNQVVSWTPQDIAAGYDLNPLYTGSKVLDGRGVTMANATSGAAVPSDLATFQKTFNLPAAQMITVPIGGPLSTYGNGESTLDVDSATAVAREVTFEQVVAHGTGNHQFDLVYEYIVDKLGKTVHVVTTSWGLCEQDMRRYPSLGIDQRLMEQAAAEGQFWFAASGDTGTDDCMDGTKSVSVDFPGSDTHVVDVGGTNVQGEVAGIGSRRHIAGWLSETTWQYSNSDGASGGGRSILYKKPAYQEGVTPKDGVRDVPDVALIADNINDGMYTCNGGVVQGANGGTSEAAPQWAALFAIIQQRYGAKRFAAPHARLYELAKSSNYALYFHDIVKGNNGVPASDDPYGAFPGYNAGKGFDPTTGWGSFIGDALVKAY